MHLAHFQRILQAVKVCNGQGQARVLCGTMLAEVVIVGVLVASPHQDRSIFLLRSNFISKVIWHSTHQSPIGCWSSVRQKSEGGLKFCHHPCHNIGQGVQVYGIFVVLLVRLSWSSGQISLVIVWVSLVNATYLTTRVYSGVLLYHALAVKYNLLSCQVRVRSGPWTGSRSSPQALIFQAVPQTVLCAQAQVKNSFFSLVIGQVSVQKCLVLMAECVCPLKEGGLSLPWSFVISVFGQFLFESVSHHSLNTLLRKKQTISLWGILRGLV